MEELGKVIDKIEQLNEKIYQVNVEIKQLKENRDNLLDKDEKLYTKREIMFMKEYEAQVVKLEADKEWFKNLVVEERKGNSLYSRVIIL